MDRKTVTTMPPVAGAPADVQTMTYWAHLIADGHLKNGVAAKADVAKYKPLWNKSRRVRARIWQKALGRRSKVLLVFAPLFTF